MKAATVNGRPKARLTGDRVTLSHGSGGKATRALVEGVFVEAFHNPLLDGLEDGAVLQSTGDAGQRLAFTTDSFVVSPLFFPGGCIGDLAVNGTVNDLAACGAQPLALSASFIIEEGLPFEDLRRIVEAMASAARAAGTQVVTGDTKVVQRGKADGCFVTTSGVGIVRGGTRLSIAHAAPGDKVIVSGPVGDHGATVMLARGELGISADVSSDTAPLNDLVAVLLDMAPMGTHALRDATRGGLATVLNELAAASGVGVVIDEAAVPVRPAVSGVCELLGIDPLYVACEGRMVAVVSSAEAASALEAVRAHPLGREAAIIGEVTDEPAGLVLERTAFGGTRVVDMLTGDPLPRIC